MPLDNNGHQDEPERCNECKEEIIREEGFNDGAAGMCGDCYDNFSKMDAEDQIDVLFKENLGKLLGVIV